LRFDDASRPELDRLDVSGRAGGLEAGFLKLRGDVVGGAICGPLPVFRPSIRRLVKCFDVGPPTISFTVEAPPNR
jgi:hypothetical protein